MFKKFNALPTSKKLIFFLFVNSSVIEIFVLAITLISVLQVRDTLTTPDMTPLNTLVTAFCAEVASFAVYCYKSLKENTKNGIIYESALNKQEKSLEESNEEIEENGQNLEEEIMG